ncbi:MAG: cytoskeleton protein RodZ [Lentisphaeria bacterium]|jgi:cytoskeleton protein RodZ
MNDKNMHSSEKHLEETEANSIQAWAAIREAKGITLEQIAKQTNIAIKKLQAIEQGGFAHLGTDTFISGYIRSYAKCIGEPPESFVQRYREYMVDLGCAQGESVAVIGDNTRASLESIPFRTATAPLLKQSLQKISLLQASLAIIAVWVLVVLLYPGRDDATEGNSQSQTDEASGQVSERQASEQQLAERQVTVLSGEDELAIPHDDPSEAVTAIALHETASEAILHDDASQDAVEDILMLSFSDECWVNIKDATDTVLFAKLQTKGDNLRVFGLAPFEVMLGNAEAVDLMMNGRVVSTVSPNSAKTLRLTLDR